MSRDNRLVEWFERLLFGGSSVAAPPPYELKRLILRMEVEDIPWSHIIEQGGFTAFAYQVHGDLNHLTDHLEGQWIDRVPSHSPRPFQTRAVSKFWDELQLLLARRDAKEVPPLPLSPRDDETLRRLLEGDRVEEPRFQSAEFWGQVARRFIDLKRPEKLPPPSPPPSVEGSVLKLYHVTCRARGQYHDPLGMYLVPRSEHVNAAHWQTAANLEAFMHDRPSHPLARSVQTLLKKTVHELLHAEKPSALLNPCPRLDALLHNVQRIHESVQQVPHDDAPPKLIDVLQRLLALCYRDGLWEKEVPDMSPANGVVGTSLFYLTEQLRIAERERRVLWTMERRDGESVGERRERTCADYLYERDKYRYAGGPERRALPS